VCSFQIPFESPQSEVCGKGYGRFTRTAQVRPKLPYLRSSPILGTLWRESCLVF